MASVRDVILAGILISMFAIGLFVFYFAVQQTSTRMLGIAEINQSQAAVDSINGGLRAANRLDYVVFGLFIGLVLAILITGWFVGGNPLFMFIYILVSVMAVILGAVLSNVWETTTSMVIFGATIAAFPLTNNLMTYLPLILAIIGILGTIVMFGKPATDGGGGI